ncbi:TetR/AcrR family transcriptional regulator [Streptomyces scopuliridis]|uniref:TetR family transcriptional regulator n=1 Tax=Streptomyces scopuliridis RB72 TaxID=1440053 RepID=A0A2T7T654_9ACTN|nr:TetR/AcrR family transcriptional regulator [Streptomyces scopuliridis]PVE10581.1 TetR family transcriptional regulator [Streptomyces scopuliridis RB72]
MTAPATPAYRRLSVEERRTQLLDAALGLFAHRAPEDVSLDDVAAAAGVSRPLVYRYFSGGKQQLYEDALRSAADELELCFTEPPVGPPTERLGRVLDRYLAFVDQHDTGFSALLRGGSVCETSRTTAIVDEVRRAAAEQILLHLGTSGTGGTDGTTGTGDADRTSAPAASGARLRMLVRTWIAAVESASLIWLDEEKRPPAGELRDWLVDHLIALLVVTAATDEETAAAVGALVAYEHPDGPVGTLARRVLPLVNAAAHLP